MTVRQSLARAFFHGEIASDELLPFPAIAEQERETLSMVLDSVRRFMEGEGESYRQHDVEGAQPESYLKALRELGLFGLIIPEEYGGIGLSNAGYSRVLQETSSIDASTSLTIGAHSSIGLKGLLLFGTPEQKARYLPRLASGEILAAFCLTEAGAGSDAASVQTTATKQADGSWLLSGEKIWITNGPLADFFTVFARTSSEKGKLSAFIVERGFGGVSHGKKEDKMGIRASATSTVRFEGTRVPAENLLGEEGHGFKIAMAILNNGRTGLGGGCVGAMKRCIAGASQQVVNRKQFGREIHTFGLVQQKLGQMMVNCFAAESVVSVVAGMVDSGHDDYSVEAAISKVFATEALWNTVDETIQIFGGNGFMREYPYERVLRDCRINRIFEGTNEVLRLYIALTGLKDVGEALKEVGRSAAGIFNDPIKGFGVLTEYAAKKVRQAGPVAAAGGAPEWVPEALAAEGAVLRYYTTWLARASEALVRKYRKDIVERQYALARISNVAIDLMVGTAVLARVSEMKGDGEAVTIARTFIQQAKRRMNHNLRKLEREEDAWLTQLASVAVRDGRYRW